MLPVQKSRSFLLSFALFAFECHYLYLNAFICKHKYAKNLKALFTLPPSERAKFRERNSKLKFRMHEVRS